MPIGGMAHAVTIILEAKRNTGDHQQNQLYLGEYRPILHVSFFCRFFLVCIWFSDALQKFILQLWFNYRDIGNPNAVEMRKDLAVFDNFTAPGVEMHCLYGHNVDDTVDRFGFYFWFLIFWRKFSKHNGSGLRRFYIHLMRDTRLISRQHNRTHSSRQYELIQLCSDFSSLVDLTLEHHSMHIQHWFGAMEMVRWIVDHWLDVDIGEIQQPRVITKFTNRNTEVLNIIICLAMRAQSVILWNNLPATQTIRGRMNYEKWTTQRRRYDFFKFHQFL